MQDSFKRYHQQSSIGANRRRRHGAGGDFRAAHYAGRVAPDQVSLFAHGRDRLAENHRRRPDTMTSFLDNRPINTGR